MQFNVRMFLHSLGNTSRHFRAMERPLSGSGSADESEATEHWRSTGLFRVMRFISSRNTNGPENQVVTSLPNKATDSPNLKSRDIGIPSTSTMAQIFLF